MSAEVNPNRLEPIVKQIGEAVLATTETIDRLSERMDALVVQVQQQGYQIFALSDAVQTLAENHDASMEQLAQLTDRLHHLANTIENRKIHS